MFHFPEIIVSKDTADVWYQADWRNMHVSGFGTGLKADSLSLINQLILHVEIKLVPTAPNLFLT